MRIRTRLTLWFAGVLVIALLAMSLSVYYELVLEPRQKAREARMAAKPPEPADPPMEEIGEALLWCGIPALVWGWVAAGG